MDRSLEISKLFQNLAHSLDTTVEELRQKLQATDRRVVEIRKDHFMQMVDAILHLDRLSNQLEEAGSIRQAKMAREAANLVRYLNDEMASVDPADWS